MALSQRLFLGEGFQPPDRPGRALFDQAASTPIHYYGRARLPFLLRLGPRSTGSVLDAIVPFGLEPWDGAHRAPEPRETGAQRPLGLRRMPCSILRQGSA